LGLLCFNTAQQKFLVPVRWNLLKANSQLSALRPIYLTAYFWEKLLRHWIIILGIFARFGELLIVGKYVVCAFSSAPG